MSCKARRGESGFTLVEVLMAIGLLAIMATAMGVLLVGQIRAGVSNLKATRAVALAERELEELRGMDYEQVVSRGQTIDGPPRFTVATLVENDVPAENMKTINVQVLWDERSGQRRYSVDAIYTDITR